MRRRFDVLSAVVLTAAIAAPTVDELARDLSVRGPELNEYRPAAPLPRWPGTASGWNALPKAFEAWFLDAFGLRDVLIRLNSLDKLFVFGRSPTARATLGRDLWMFYSGEREMEVARGQAALTRADLERWRSVLEAQRDAMRRRGIAYVFAIAPNKESVYPEKLPARFDRVGATRLDQLLAHMHEHSDVELLDLRPALQAEKERDVPDEDRLYFPQGTHWYGRGALAAYRAIVRALAATFPALEPLRDDELAESAYGQDSWANRMYVFDLFPQSCRAFVPRAPRATIVRETPDWSEGERVTEVPDARLPRAVFMHDSMLGYYAPLVAENFSHAAFLWTHQFDVDRIASARPDVVVVTYLEIALQDDDAGDLVPFNDSFGFDSKLASADVTVFDLAVADPPPVAPSGPVDVTVASGRLELRVRGPRGLVTLPPADLRGCRRVYASVEVETSEVAYLALAYRLPDDPGYLRARMLSHDLQAGRTPITWELDAPDSDVTFALVASETKEPLVLYKLAIRATKGPVDAPAPPR